MIGWHWTSATNWEGIQASGELQEYPINKPEVEEIIGSSMGIFAFEDGPDDEVDEVGCVYFQAVSKKNFHVVLLWIDYEPDEVKEATAPDFLCLTHNGKFSDDWAYHLQKVIVVLRGPIPLSRITLVKRYDVLDVLTHAVDARRFVEA